MKKAICRLPALALIGAISVFAGCAGRTIIKPPPVPVSIKTSIPDKPAAPVVHKNTQPLFIIERNKNANVVHYDANLTPDGKLDPGNPVIAYWMLLAEDGRRKNLNWMEKKKAYGVKIRPDASHNGYILTLAAAPWMPLAVKNEAGSAHVEADIGGRPAILQKMFIQSRERLMGPKVEYIELYGKDRQTGEALREKILPR